LKSRYFKTPFRDDIYMCLVMLLMIRHLVRGVTSNIVLCIE